MHARRSKSRLYRTLPKSGALTTPRDAHMRGAPGNFAKAERRVNVLRGNVAAVDGQQQRAAAGIADLTNAIDDDRASEAAAARLGHDSRVDDFPGVLVRMVVHEQEANFFS